jgi:hypothetical protein
VISEKITISIIYFIYDQSEERFKSGWTRKPKGVKGALTRVRLTKPRATILGWFYVKGVKAEIDDFLKKDLFLPWGLEGEWFKYDDLTKELTNRMLSLGHPSHCQECGNPESLCVLDKIALAYCYEGALSAVLFFPPWKLPPDDLIPYVLPEGAYTIKTIRSLINRLEDHLDHRPHLQMEIWAPNESEVVH